MYRRLSRRGRAAVWAAGVVLLACVGMVLLQTAAAHRPGSAFVPGYPREDLGAVLEKGALEEADYALLMCQTGLGRAAADKLLAGGEAGRGAILRAQEAFFAPVEVVCDPMLGWFTREDHLRNAGGERMWGPELVDLQPGDVILTLSTHSLGWRHGHAGLVVETREGLACLECAVLGTDSAVTGLEHWRAYSNYAVLRVRGADAEARAQTAAWAAQRLTGVPYRLSAGLIGPKAPAPESAYFGLQCSYLVWYAWQAAGFDLDSDGGRLVTTRDLLDSGLLEVVQVYGMDPRRWAGEGN